MEKINGKKDEKLLLNNNKLSSDKSKERI